MSDMGERANWNKVRLKLEMDVSSVSTRLSGKHWEWFNSIRQMAARIPSAEFTAGWAFTFCIWYCNLYVARWNLWWDDIRPGALLRVRVRVYGITVCTI